MADEVETSFGDDHRNMKLNVMLEPVDGDNKEDTVSFWGSEVSFGDVYDILIVQIKR